MAKSKVDLDSLLTKISHVFLRDGYIINNNFVIGGEETSDESLVESFVELGIEYSPVISELYPEIKTIFISNIKEAKKDKEANIITKIDDKLLEYSEKKYNKLKKIVDSITCWSPLELTEKEIESIFDEGKCTDLFSDSKQYPSVLVGKKMFPLVSKKNIGDVYFSVIHENKDSNIYTLVTRIDVDGVIVYTVVTYIGV